MSGHTDRFCCKFGRMPGRSFGAPPVDLCDYHRAQLADFNDWLQQYRGHYLVTVQP